MNSMKDEIEDSSAPLIEHLAELRTRLIRAVLAFFGGMVLCFFVAEPILNLILEPICSTLRARGEACTLNFFAPQEYFFLLIRISMVFGFAASFPVVAYQLWRFVAPGLYKSEKGAFLPFLIASPVLFLLGASFAHLVVTPLAMNFFIGFADVVPRIAERVAGDAVVAVPAPPPVSENPTIVFQARVTESLDLSLKFILAFGLCFQLPVLLTLMAKAGLVGVVGLRKMRKYAIVGILVLAALLTPPDVISQMILFTVVYALYEVSIFLVARVERKRNADLRAMGLLDEDEEDGATV